MRKFWIVKAIIFASLFITGITYAVMSLWNYLVPDLFHGPSIEFPQALGLLVLCKILFHGFGWRGRHPWKHHQWRERMQKKMDEMTPEERARFKEQWQRRCGWRGRWSEPAADEQVKPG